MSGQCKPCRRGDYHICDHLKVQGFQAPGCAQQWFVTAVEKVVPLPEDFTFEQGALVEPAAVAVHAVVRAGDVAGQNAVVLGAGPIGNLVAQVARASDADVLVTDLSDFRLDVARRCGISHTSRADRETLWEATARAFGSSGFDVAWDCTGCEAPVDAAVGSIAKGGRLVVVGVFAEKPRVDLGLVQDRELSLLGTLMYRRNDYQRAIELIVAGKIATGPLDSAHFRFEDYAAAYEFIERQSDRSMKVFIDLFDDSIGPGFNGEQN
ncbi:MAG: zinc-binding dehydrogenase [Pirellulales bacterium]|nr:zinc-binding dehydrogenase [Pirellulales bacterium]